MTMTMTMTETSDHRAAPTFEPVDKALRDDVRRLGSLVGEMLVEQHGEAFYERVEGARIAAIRRRERALPVEALSTQLAGLDAATADAVCRAFATYFQVVNIAERVHRIRRRREYQVAGAAAQPDGLQDVLERLRASGVEAEQLFAALPRIDVEPVFTAHPTEASRRTLLEKEQIIVASLVADFSGPRTRSERETDWARLQMALVSSWQTADNSHVRPTVQDELDHVDFYLSDPIYRVLPVFYESLEDAISEVYGTCPQLGRMLRFASWVGGDMDGNPHVGATTIAATLRTQRSIVLARYRRDCAALARLLSQTIDRAAFDGAILARLEDYRRRLPDAAAKIRPRHANMPYRCLLQLVDARLAASMATSDAGAGSYANAGEFAADLALIADSLQAHGGVNAGCFAVRRLQRRISAFGFHLARLDVRQHADVHWSALAEAIGGVPADAAARGQWIAPFASGEVAFRDRVDSDVASAVIEDDFGEESSDIDVDESPSTRTRAVFEALAKARDRHGDGSIGVYVISMAASVADVLAVLALARDGGCVDDAGMVPLDIAPLFETIADLRAAPATFAAMLDDTVYRAHLTARDDRQTVMLGYSDSSKDGGILASRWSLQRAQVELLTLAAERGIALTFFHGRGGSMSRGGGKTSRAVMAAPRGAIAGRLRVTEQGEVIHRKYGIRALALRTLEQTVGAVIAASLRPRPPEPREARWREVMHALAGDGSRCYRALVAETPQFVDYFRFATPIDVIERMTLGSRPSRRGGNTDVASLRAIPWVFAWTQCRSNLTGWYGVGSALDAAAARGDADVIAEMARDWAFFRTLVEDLEMLLAKSDLDIAEQFSRLSGDLHAMFFPAIAAEFQRTLAWVLRLRGRDSLLADDPRLAESIRLRNPYTDPMSLVQVDLLARWRSSNGEDGALFSALVSSVHGVAQALQNTG